MEIKHHFYNRDFYSPNWEIKFLFIGTFNPSGGEAGSNINEISFK